MRNEEHPLTPRHWTRKGLVLLMFTSSVSAGAQTLFDVDVGYEAEATDNVRRENSNTREDLIHRPFVTLGYSQQFGRVDLSGSYRFEARRYQRSSFDSDEVLMGTSAADISLIPGRLSWRTDHVRSETLLDRRNADRPDNRRESDTLGTGLTWLIVGGTSPNQLTTSARAELFDSNRGFDDSKRYSGSLEYRRRLSPVQGVGLRTSGLAVDYDEELVPDYDRWTVQATFDRQLRRTGMDLGVGYNEVRRTGMSSNGGLAISASGYFEPATGHRLTASAQREFTDRSLQMVRGIRGFGEDRDEESADGNVFELTRFRFGYDYSRGSWSAGVNLEAVDEDHDLVPRDSRRLIGTVTAGYRMTPVLTMDVSLRAQRRKFTDENRTDDLYGLDLRWVWQVVQRTSLSLGFGYEERDSNAGGRDYVERRVMLSVRHRLW